jgi:hypothetical protein
MHRNGAALSLVGSSLPVTFRARAVELVHDAGVFGAPVATTRCETGTRGVRDAAHRVRRCRPRLGLPAGGLS